MFPPRCWGAAVTAWDDSFCHGVAMSCLVCSCVAVDAWDISSCFIWRRANGGSAAKCGLVYSCDALVRMMFLAPMFPPRCLGIFIAAWDDSFCNHPRRASGGSRR